MDMHDFTPARLLRFWEKGHSKATWRTSRTWSVRSSFAEGAKSEGRKKNLKHLFGELQPGKERNGEI